MKVIGIAGGIASGKSLVTTLLSECGASILDADRVGHEVLTESDVRHSIRDRWGDLVFASNGSVNRAALAQIVFAAPPKGPIELAKLEEITHPRIKQRLEIEIKSLRSAKAVAAVLDAPVLFKARWDSFCDVVLFVETPRERRLNWAIERGWTEAEFDARECAQTPLEVKRSRSDFFLDNSKSKAHLHSQVMRFWQENVKQAGGFGVE